MRRSYLCVAACLVALVSASLVRADQTVDTKAAVLLEKAREVHKSWKTLQAEQTMVMEFGGQKRTMAGSVKVQKPGKTRLEMGGDMPMTMVSDGKTFFLYYKTLNQYRKVTAKDKSPQKDSIMDLEAGPFDSLLKLPDYQTIEFVGKEKIDGVECDVIKASKRDAEYFIYLQPDFRVRRTIGRDTNTASKSEILTDFRNYVVDAPLDPALFRFKLPRGAKEMKM